jgi:predicted nucleic acid-binding protein
MIALDTNLLIYAHRRGVPQHAASRRAIADALGRAACGVAVQALAEFWAVVTHPSSEGGASKPAVARAFLTELTKAGVATWTPAQGFGPRLIAAAESRGITGPRVFDLQIGLTAAEAGATEIWTADHGFVSVPGVLVVHPF